MPTHSPRRSFALAAAAGTIATLIAPETEATAMPGPAAIPPIDPANPFATSGAAPAARRQTHTVRQLYPDVATPESFAPFGWVLSPDAGRPRLPINTYGPDSDLFREGFESDQPIEWFIVRFAPRGTGVLFLERHQQLTQTFIPLGGAGFFTVVARPGAREEDGLPALDELRAFWVPGDRAIQLRRATWHENPIPGPDGEARLLVTSHAALTLAHQQSPDPALRALPLDLERRWYRAAGYEVTVAV